MTAPVNRSKLTGEWVQGQYYKSLAQDTGIGWIDMVSNMFESTQDEEEYVWLGMPPAMRERIGGRNPKELREFDYSIKNKKFESTLRIKDDDMYLDKTGQLKIRIADHATRPATHWASLLSTLTLNGLTTVCYDGQYYFDTDHVEGDSGAQSNKMEVDISGLPVEINGSTTEPSVEEMQFAIKQGIARIRSFVDDQGEPLNETSKDFLVMSGIGLADTIDQALATRGQVAASQTVLDAFQRSYNVGNVSNVRLDGWTDQFVIFRTDVQAKAFIRQQLRKIRMSQLGPGSDNHFYNDEWLFGIDVDRNVGYGLWQHAVHVKLV
jgi:phage major head subunit gpT-like protein